MATMMAAARASPTAHSAVAEKLKSYTLLTSSLLFCK